MGAVVKWKGTHWKTITSSRRYLVIKVGKECTIVIKMLDENGDFRISHPRNHICTEKEMAISVALKLEPHVTDVLLYAAPFFV